VTLTLYWNYSNIGLSEWGNRYHNELIDPSIYPSAMPLTWVYSYLSLKCRFPVSLSLTSSVSAAFTHSCIFFCFFLFLFFRFLCGFLYGTFSDGWCATIHSRLGDYGELTPSRVNLRICRGQFKSHVSQV